MDKDYYRDLIASRSKLSPAPDESKGVGVEFRPQGQEIEEVYEETEEEKVRRMKKMTL